VRQFFILRFWLTLLALAGLALAVVWFTGNRESASVDGADVGAPAGRTIDLVAWVFAVQPPVGFDMVDGRTTTDLALVIDATRTMIILAGTPGEIDCPRLTDLGQCTVAVDLLGDGVLWFSIIPGIPGSSVELPAVAELLSGGWVRLENGWVVQHAPKIARSCPEDTASLGDFIDLFGATARATFNFEQQQIVKVTCPNGGATTTTTAPTTTIDPLLPTTVPLPLVPLDPTATEPG